jgi:GT2 family glycosyltransferase
MPGSEPRVGIVVVTFNSKEEIGGCVSSAAMQKGVVSEIIVVDNASGDGTPELVRGLPCQLIEPGENLGFGRACNLGARQTAGDYLFFLNPDARFEHQDSLYTAIRCLELHPTWGMAGVRILSNAGTEVDPPRTDYPGERSLHSPWGKLPGTIAWVLGAGMLFRRDVFEQLGGFDPDFFLYAEEIDLCLRTRKAGFEIGFIRESAITHVGGTSVSTLAPARLADLKLRGLLTFMTKHYSPEICRKLIRKEILRAGFRMHWNALLGLFSPMGSRLRNKSDMYRVIRDTNREYLSVLGH